MNLHIVWKYEYLSYDIFYEISLNMGTKNLNIIITCPDINNSEEDRDTFYKNELSNVELEIADYE